MGAKLKIAQVEPSEEVKEEQMNFIFKFIWFILLIKTFSYCQFSLIQLLSGEFTL